MNELIGTSRNELVAFDMEISYTNTLTKETNRAYMSVIKEFFGVSCLSEIDVQKIRNVTPFMFNEWAKKQVEDGRTPATVNKKLSALQNFYSFLCRRNVGIMDYNPLKTSEGCIRFKNATKSYSDKRSLEPTEVHQIFSSVVFPEDMESNEYTIAIRDLIVLELLATTGMRRGEIIGIKLGDIRIISGRYVVEITGKGNKTRPMIIASSIKKHIDDYIGCRCLTYRDSEYPLIANHSSNYVGDEHVSEMTIYRIVKKYAELSGVGVEDIAPHNFRHTFCTNSIQMGIEIHTVQDLMGHESTSTTRRYEHIVRTINDSPADALSSMFGIN